MKIACALSELRVLIVDMRGGNQWHTSKRRQSTEKWQCAKRCVACRQARRYEARSAKGVVWQRKAVKGKRGGSGSGRQARVTRWREKAAGAGV